MSNVKCVDCAVNFFNTVETLTLEGRTGDGCHKEKAFSSFEECTIWKDRNLESQEYSQMKEFVHNAAYEEVPRVLSPPTPPLLLRKQSVICYS